MDFPIIRRKTSPPLDATAFINGFLGDRRSHVPEKNLPGGGNWVVQKFGGTSVGKFPVKIAEDIVQAGLEPGRRIAVVCSARSSTTKTEGTTNRLVRAAIDVLDQKSGKFREIIKTIQLDHLQAGRDACSVWGANSQILDEYTAAVNLECKTLLKILESAQFLKAVTDQTEDMVISAGEKLSCLYMTAILQSRGVNAVYVDLSEVIQFDVRKSLDEKFYLDLGKAIANKITSLGDDVVPVITGYFGNVPGGLLKEIGRGYTDLCAALTAVGLQAEELQIWKEVDGIFTADPRKVPTARLLDSVTPSEASELTFYGSEVIHPFTMDQVIKAHIPIRIKNVMNPPNKGTVVTPDREDELLVRQPGLFRGRSSSNLSAQNRPKRPTAVTTKRGITVLNVHSKKRTRSHGFLMSIFKILDHHHLSVDLISSSEVHVSMALHSEISLLYVDLVPGMAIISLVGRQLRSMVGISGKFLDVFF
ncbi:uncharacterized protein MYCFIDRAFT_211536 [Pseudocercospora fijiensis CIRAD86]|uniref:Aspartokinase n=1 Tax=Pseudocercospora fijiensis (strain CIRAD86) TaxID=383855 RepID=M3AX46_PSEFD|nr:uncharacterized protein MYCFIDRAFT_211536 [Pseudocercospora fijiensis CIRAD86]EME82047.1 hypothetical protein MYCFIDRAFT_211536 [Pseudocercospora fijiensis CIRAD86]